MHLLQPSEASALLSRAEVTLVDIRSAGEFRREHLENAQNIPAEDLGNANLDSGPVLFYCRTGRRTGMAGDNLTRAVCGETYVLKGGLEAWTKEGLPVKRDESAPLPLERQVQLAIGIMLLIAMSLSATVSPWFGVIPAFIGCGLVMAGATGFCGLGIVIAKMPWNRA